MSDSEVPADPPALYTKPGSDELLGILDQHAQNVIRNFEKTTSNDPHNFYQWLTSVCSSPLLWIENEDVRDEIWQKAALRIAERSGRTANPQLLREIEIPGLKPISLIEPPLTGDFLGLKTWGSSFVLSDILVREKGLMQGEVLELGSGTGLCGITAALLGHKVVATDLKEIVGNLEDNFRENGIANVEIRTLDWTAPEPFLADTSTANKYPTVILADPVYSDRHPPWIRDMLQEFLNRDSEARAIICVPLRRKFDDERALLWKILKELGLQRVRGGEVEGEDEFGKMTYTWGEWRWIDVTGDS